MSETIELNPRLVFEAVNVHSDSCGEPPRIRWSDNPSYYYGYHENSCGEQWVFVFDPQTKTAVLRGGDVGWEEVPVLDGKQPIPYIMDQMEQVWLLACWCTAHERFGLKTPPLEFPDFAKMLRERNL